MKISLQIFSRLIHELRFILGTILTGLLFFAILRALLLMRNPELASAIPITDLARAFLVGLRFDLIIISYTLLPIALVLGIMGSLGQRRWVRFWLYLSMAIALLAGIIELDFYYEFHTRLNSIAFQYLKEDPATVSSMIWHGFPVIRYLLLWLLLTLLYIVSIRWLHRHTYNKDKASPPVSWTLRLSTASVIIVLLIIGARGSTLRSGPPLRWGDAFHSPHLFANHLALNGTYTLFKAAKHASHQKKGKKWRHLLAPETALQLTQTMLLQAGDQPLYQAQAPLLRQHTPAWTQKPLPIRNIVLIIMESFSAPYVGALGSPLGITPEFDQLTKEGLLFTRFFSSGTHTHQGMFASVACFPNVPGFEYLMQQPQGRNRFSGLPTLLKPRGFADLYVYNGIFSWDNQEGFFRNQGMTRFIGRDDMENPHFIDPTWGVSDQDMFDRAVVELAKMDPEKPFFAVLQTLSNHTPYALPEQLPFARITDQGERSEHLTAMKYSDWALGRFFQMVKPLPSYAQTLFVIVGDHGFGNPAQIADIDLLRFHVPLLLIGPQIQQRFGQQISRVGSQPDIVPTMVSLLNVPFKHQCWGRDLLSLPASDAGFAVIKPSGNNQTVARIEDDLIVVKSPNRPAELGRYRVGPDHNYQILNDPEQRQVMEKRLYAFVQSALNALYANSTGIP